MLFNLNDFTNTVTNNVKYAAYMKIGKDTTDFFVQLVASRLPGAQGAVVGHYMNTPLGRLIVVQLVQAILKENFSEFFKSNPNLAKALSAAVTANYVDVVNQFDLKGMLADVMHHSSMLNLLNAAEGVKAPLRLEPVWW